MERKVIMAVEGRRFTYSHRIVEGETPESFPSHIHDTCELLMLLQGNVNYTIEGRSYKLNRGDLVFTRPSVFHRIIPERNTTYERYNVIFDEKMLPEKIRQRIPNIDIFPYADNPRIMDLFEKIDEYGKNFEEEELKRLVSHLIEEIFYNMALFDSIVSKRSNINPIVNSALLYIRDNLCSVKNITEICDSLYITKSHLHHLFISSIGVTPKQYIISKRLLLAKKKINTGMKPTEASSSVGFDDYATFFRNYKKHFGYAPSAEAQPKS